MPLLETRDVRKVFGGLTALKGVSLSVNQGEIFGIIGPNGAGKTTLFNIIAGTFRPTAGEVYFEGAPIHMLSADQIARKGIARTFQITRVFKELTVEENVLVALGKGRYASPFNALGPFRLPRNVAVAHELLAQVDLAHLAKVPAKQLTLGMQRRLELARALATEPKLLLLDEPTAGLGHSEVDQIIEICQRINSQGTTLVLVEHNMRVATMLCSSLAVLYYGEIIAQGKPHDVMRDETVVRAYLGEDEDVLAVDG